MAPLSGVRLQFPLRAFAQVSVDYGGPFITVQGRGKRQQKRWLCLFTCLTCRAVYLEMASRRGYPLEIVSDRELRELVKRLKTSKIQDQTVNKGVKWSFNPPLAPHFGGVHEVMIKAIHAILGNADVNDCIYRS